MSYAICRVQKIKSTVIGGLQAHNRREHDKSYTNPDIDWSKKHLNYEIFSSLKNKSFNKLADERIAQAYTGTKAVRKDAVKLCEALFTSDKTFFDKLSQKEQENFFQDCYKWACNRYGKENIISAIVHMDEQTPHMHVDFVPLTKCGRLSAKAIVGNRSELQALQDDYYEKVGKIWGLERGERTDFGNSNAEKPRRHLDTAEYKKQQLENQIQELKMYNDYLIINRNDLENINAELNQNIENNQAKLNEIENKLRKLKEEFDNLYKTSFNGDFTDIIHCKNGLSSNIINNLDLKRRELFIKSLEMAEKKNLVYVDLKNGIIFLTDKGKEYILNPEFILARIEYLQSLEYNKIQELKKEIKLSF